MKLPRIWMSPIWKRLPVLSESAAWMPCAQSRTTLSRICTSRAMTPPTTMPWFPKRGPVSPIGAPRRTRLSATLSSATSTTSTPICVEPTSNWFPVMRTTSEDASALGRTVRHERVREAASRQPIVQPVTLTSTQPLEHEGPVELLRALLRPTALEAQVANGDLEAVLEVQRRLDAVATQDGRRPGSVHDDARSARDLQRLAHVERAGLEDSSPPPTGSELIASWRSSPG